jgi:hypothetical protein
MKAKIKVSKEVEITTLLVSAGVRYWEDSSVNGVDDTEDGTLIPCKNGDYWEPIIDIETGVITNWPKGTSANIHYKVCDDGTYKLADEKGNVVLEIEGYVPKILDLDGESFGDYIIMDVDVNGKIANWNNKPIIRDFQFEDED